MKPLYLTADRAFLRYMEIPGENPPLIWVHGWQCSSTGELLPVAVQPPLQGRRSLLVDLLGHGYSDKPEDFGYTLADHARTVVALIDALELRGCGLVGHSMGGGIGILVASARPEIVSLLVMAEGVVAPDGPTLDGTEAEFVERGFPEMLEAQAREAEANPEGIRAAHLEMTRILEPRATYREAQSMDRETDPPLRSQLADLRVPRWYLTGELSDADPDFDRDMASIGVATRIVPNAGHPMGLQNPLGFAQTVADAVVAAWPR